MPAAAVVAAVGAGLLVGLLVGLPPRQLALAPLDGFAADTTVAGVSHVHSTRSDGAGSPDEIAGAAARAGLQFVILTDHGDGTRPPDPPTYRSGVLLLDGVEISTTSGHYIAVGMARAPYPLGGEARDVIQDVARLGGFGIAAHPDSPKDELRWREGVATIDGFEWLNGDSEWRDETSARLALAAIVYPFRPVETLASLLDRPSTSLLRWDALTQRRPVVGLAGSDAHARLGWADDGDGDRGGMMLGVPSYQTMFSTVSLRVEVDRPFSGEAGADARLLLAALAGGRVYSVVDGLAAPAQFELVARSGTREAQQGEALDVDGPVTIVVRSNAPAGAVTTLVRDGEPVAETPGAGLQEQLAPGPAVVRVEVRLGGDASAVPWIVSNPIYLSRLPPRALPPPAPATAVLPLDPPGAEDGWHVERDSDASQIAIERTGAGPVTVRYALAPDGVAPYVALVVPDIAPLREAARAAFRARASRPMRVSVQLRKAGAGPSERWRRSIYLDATPRDIVVVFRDMMPAGSTDTFTPDMSGIDDIILAVDTTNARPGDSGSFTVENLRLER